MNWLRPLVCGASLLTVGVAGPISPASLDKLVNDAKVIAVAKVASGSQSATSRSLVLLDVQRTLKGSVSSGLLSVEINAPAEFAVSRNLVGLQGIWFLVDGTDGIYRILPAMVGSVPLEWSILPALTDLPVTWASGPSAAPMERVLREVAADMEVKGESNWPFAFDFLSQIPATPASSVRGLYQRMLTSPVNTVSLAGLAGLLRSGDVAALASLRQKLTLPEVTGGRAGAALAQAVCEYSNANPQGLAILADLAGGPQPVPQLQECAALALRTVHSRETVPFLLALLDSQDLAVRYDAVAGLASFANSGYIPNEKPLLVDGVSQQRQPSALRTAETEENFPTLETFRKDEQRFITFWKQWCATTLAVTKP